jgi:PhnB protein
MPVVLNPYVTFDGNAREAMGFYQQVFGGTVEMSTFGDFGAQDEPFADQIMHASLRTDSGLVLMGADPAPGAAYVPGGSIGISLSGDDGDALRDLWQQLSDGGAVVVPLEPQMWGDEFGMCTDRYGVTWMVNIAGSQA